MRFDNKPPSVMRSPLRSRQEDTTPRSPTRGHGQQNQLYDPQFTEEMERRFCKKCIFCMSDEHESEQCTSLGSPEEYKKILYRFRLCFNCKSQGHSYRHGFRPSYCSKNCGNTTKHSSVVCEARSFT